MYKRQVFGLERQEPKVSTNDNGQLTVVCLQDVPDDRRHSPAGGNAFQPNKRPAMGDKNPVTFEDDANDPVDLLFEGAFLVGIALSSLAALVGTLGKVLMRVLWCYPPVVHVGIFE